MSAEILQWIEQGHVSPQNVRQALRSTNITPDAHDWRRFFNQLSLWLGTVFCAAAIIFFFAYNWQAMGRYTKFGLVELLILLSLGSCARIGLEKTAGKAALLLATLLTGALLALVGQTYQTGADTYELFAAWAIAVLPWTLLGRFSTLWLIWLALLNLATIFYFQTFGGLFDGIFSGERKWWALFALNTVALVAWECAEQMKWLRERWPVRIVATVSGGVITTLMILAIFDSYGLSRLPAMLTYAAWMAAAYAYYRYRRPDVFMLTGGVLSAIMVITAILLQSMPLENSGTFLLIGMIVISLSAMGGMWLKNVAKKVYTHE